MVYLQTYKLCILTLLCRSTVLWLSPFGNFGYILFILLTYYLGFQILAFSSADEESISEMAIQDIKIGIDWFFFTCKSYCRSSTVPCKNQTMSGTSVV